MKSITNQLLFCTFCIFSYKCTNDKCFNFEKNNLTRISYSQGCLNNSVEEGLWIVYDSSKTVIERGEFEDGLRFGEWVYKYTTSENYSIKWSKFTLSEPLIKINIPQFLDTIIRDSIFVIFKPKTTNKEVLILSLEDSKYVNKNPKSYHHKIEGEMADLGYKYSKVTKIVKVNAESEYYTNAYHFTNESGDSFDFINFYGLTDMGDFFEISIKTPDFNHVYKSIFVSVISNIFVKNHRLIFPYGEINPRS